MKNGRRSRIAAVAVAAAMGFGAIGYVVRGAPTALQALAAWRNGPSPRDSGPVAAGSDSPAGWRAVARSAIFTPGSAGSSQAFAQNVSFKPGNNSFTGKREYAYYGYVKVQAVIQDGRLTDVKILEYPSDNGRSRYINFVALPYLIQEAVDAQSFKVDLISGATFTSVAFEKSLQEALKAAGA